MMNYGITSSRFFTGLILALTLFPMISCEKESFIPALTPEPVEPQNLAEAAHMPREKAHMQDSAFVFEIQESNSYTPGCVCGNTATIFITRLSDGLSMRHTVDLPSCGNDLE